MRIISQDGSIDVPYEMSAIRNDDKLIILCMAGETGKGSVIATYRTSEKAQKAMEMLRTAYTGTPLIFENCDVTDEVFAELKRRSIEAILTVTNDKPKVDYLDNFYFQFPQDEDVEV